MKNRLRRTWLLLITISTITNISYGQKIDNRLNLISEYSSSNSELRDILQFEGIEYLKLKFTGQDLKTKSFKLYVKEIWNGKIVNDTIVVDSKSIGIKQFETVNDTILSLKVISKLTNKNKLRLTFKFPRFSISKEYAAIETDEYSLRNIADESRIDIGYNEKFYLLAYIVPYKRKDGSKSWCEVGSSGKDVENWGQRFGLKHYLLFEMKFENHP